MKSFNWLVVYVNAMVAVAFLAAAIATIFFYRPTTEPAQQWLNIVVPVTLMGLALLCGFWTKQAYEDAKTFGGSAAGKSEKPKDSQRTYVPKEYVPGPEVVSYMRAQWEVLSRHGVVQPGELCEASFQKVLATDEWQADFWSFHSVLSETVGLQARKFANLYCGIEQTEQIDGEFCALIKRLAMMLRVDESLASVDVELVKEDEREVRLDFQHQNHVFQGKFPGKYMAWEILAEITSLFESVAGGSRLAVLFNDMQFSIAAMTSDQRLAINRELDDEDGFQWISQ